MPIAGGPIRVLPTAGEVFEALKTRKRWERFVEELFREFPRQQAEAFLNSLAVEPPGSRGRTGFTGSSRRREDSGSVATTVAQPAPGSLSINLGGAGAGSGRTGPSATALRGQLASSSFGVIPWARDYIDDAVRRDEGLDYVIGRIVADPRLEKSYPGITSRGTVRMSPSEWETQYQQYNTAARQFGYSVSRREAGALVGADISPQEAGERYMVARTIQDRGDVFAAFNQQIDLVNRARGRQGLPQLPKLDSPGLIKAFVTRKAPKELYRLYEGAVIQAAGSSFNITAREAQRLAAGPDVVTAEQAEERFARLAAQTRTAGAELEAFGLSRDELLTIEFGGANRVELADRLERALAQREAQLRTTLAAPVSRLDQRSGRPTSGFPQAPGY